jgi:leucyl-tRNA synthetase
MTFIVIAPEHEMVSELTTPEQKQVVEAYVAACMNKSELERQQEGKEKTGVFTGSYVVNHLTGEQVPIWVADFVLANFGTGAVQGCPAHDERDFEFAKKFNLPIIRVVTGPNGETDKFVNPETEQVDQVKLNHGIDRKMVNSHQFDGFTFDDAMQKTMDYFENKSWGRRVTNYKIRDWSVSRQRYWGAPIPIIHCPKDGIVLDENLPVLLPELEDFQPSGDGRSALARADEWLHVDCPTCGGPAERETDTLDTYICSSWYELRYFDPHNDQAPFSSSIANKWMPVDFYNGGDHATAHLIYVRFIARFFHKLGLLDDPEPFKKFLFNGKVTASDGTMFSKSKGNGVDPLEIIASGYGADALRTYLMFAAPLDIWMRWDPQGVPGTYRFLNRVFNLVQEFVEFLQSQGAKEPRSQGNTSPSPQPQNTSSQPATSNLEPLTSNLTSKDVLRSIHIAIKQVTSDLEEQKYNTAVAAMMKCTNELYELKAKQGFGAQDSWQFALDSLVALVAPFAPHVADELWQDLGHETTVQRSSWPAYDEQYLAQDTVTLAVQVNGKLRGTVQVPADADEATSVKTAKQDAKVSVHLADKTIAKTIYIPAKLINFVVK